MPAVTEPDDVGHDTTDASVDARHGLVVTTHHLASKAGAGVLAAGGNASTPPSPPTPSSVLSSRTHAGRAAICSPWSTDPAIRCPPCSNAVR